MSKPGKQTKAQAQRSKRIAMNKDAARLLPGRMSETLCEAARIAGATAGTVTLASTLSATPAHALPQNGTVVGGSASISQAGGSTLNINQTTNSAIINWQGYNIGASELVQYTQPGSSSIILNRVTGGDPSAILGSLTANGQVWVINPNGLLVGPGAKIQTGSFLGSTLGIGNEDFSAGNYRLTGAPSSLASIINHGNIQAADGGYVVLAAPSVTNTGTIAAHLGKVALASGDQLTLGFQGNDLIDIVITEEAASGALGVKNTGLITADGGSVILSAKVATDLLKEVVNNEGIIQATSIVEKDGVIILDGGSNGTVANSGTLDASGMDAGEKGGSVKVLGEQVQVSSGAAIDASGDSGGGTVLIEGNLQATVAQGAVIKADAVTDGDGGDVDVLSQGTAAFHGNISARGGAAGGVGGDAEVSGRHVAISGLADLLAPKGKAGVLEVESGSVSIVDGVAPNAALDTITDGWINTQLESANLEITAAAPTDTASQNITVHGGIDVVWNSVNALTLSAGKDISLYGSFTGTNGTLTVRFDQSGTRGNLWFRPKLAVGQVSISGSGSSSWLLGSETTDTIFTVTGLNTGMIDNKYRFENVAHLVAGSGNDFFIFEKLGSLSGGVYGEAGKNTVDLKAKENVTFNHRLASATDIPMLQDINVVVGNGANSTFIGRDTDRTYNFSDVDSGNVVSGQQVVLEFDGFGNVTGGSGNDTFNFQDGGSLSGLLDGGGGLGEDTLNYSARSGKVEINQETSEATGVAGYGGIERVVGNGIDSTIIGADAGEAFTVTGADVGTAGALGFTGVGNLTGGSGNDTFVLQDAGSLSGNLAGGAGSDSLDVSAKTGDVTFDRKNSSVTGIGGTFSSIETVAGNGVKSTIIGTDNGETFTLTGGDAGTVGELAFTGVGNLTGGAGDDSFVFQEAGSLTGSVAGGAGSDILNLNAKVGDVVFDTRNSTATDIAGTYSGIETLEGNGAKSTLLGADAGETFTVTGADAGTAGSLAFTGVGNLTGGSGNDSFVLQDLGSLSGNVAGGGGANSLDLSAKLGNVIFDKQNSTATDIAGTFSGIQSVAGNGAKSTIVGADTGETFTVTGADSGTVGALSFTGVGSLTGGTGNDTFVLQDAGRLSGNLYGNGGADLLDMSAKTGAVTLDRQNSTVTDIGGTLFGIESLAGNGAKSTIIAADAGEAFTVTGADAGTVGDLAFSGVGNLTGGAGDDSFIFEESGRLTGNVAGGAGTDVLALDPKSGDVVFDLQKSTATDIAGTFSGIETLSGNGTRSTIIGADAGETFTLTAGDTGTVGAMVFVGVGNLTGGSGNDSFVLQDAGSLSGNVVGGGGANSLDLSAKAGNVIFDKQNSSATDIGGTFSEIQTVAGNGAKSMIFGADAGETFTVTGADAGTAGALSFTGVGNLTGGSGNDSFVLRDAGSLSGNLAGNDGADSIDWSAKAAAVTLNRQDSTVTGIAGNVFSIESVAGNGAQSTIIAANVGEAFTVTGADAGTVGDLAFTGVGNLTGGAGDDSFILQNDGTLSGSVAGGAGDDALNLNAKVGEVIFNKESRTATGIAGNFSDIETVAGSGLNSTIVGANAGETFTVTAGDTGTVGTLNFVSVGNLTGGSGNDSFVLQDAGSLSGNVVGGDGADTLDLSAKLGSVVFNKQNSTATDIAGTFSGIESVAGNGDKSTIIGADAGETFRVTGADAGTVGPLGFSGVGNLTGGSGNDTFVLQGGTEYAIEVILDGKTFAVANTGSVAAANFTDLLVIPDKGGTLSGSIAGGDGSDSLDLSAKFGGVTFDKRSNTVTDVDGTFSAIESVVGNGARSTIIGSDAGETFTVTGADTGRVGDLRFTGVGNLVGGDGNDTFVLEGPPRAIYSEITIITDPVARTLASTSAVTLIAPGYNDVGYLPGGSGDLLMITPVNGGTLSGSIAGGGGSDSLDLSGKSGAVTFNKQSNSATDIGGSFSRIESVVGNGAGSTIIAAHTGENFTVTGADAGTVGALGFSGVGNLTGNLGNDTFVLQNAGSLSGNVVGGGGFDTLNMSAKVGDVTFDRQNSTATGIAGKYLGIESVVGNGSRSTIIAIDAGETFRVTGADAGTVGTLAFTGVGNLTGGLGDDSVVLHAGGALSGDAVGGGGYDTLNLAEKPLVTFNLETNEATAIGGTFTEFEAVAGNGANSTIIGRNISQTYKITGRDSGTVGVGDDVDLAFSGVGNLTGGSRDDYFLIKPDGSVSGNLEGGGDSDHLFVSSKPTQVVFNLENSTVSYVDGKFTGFEQIAGNGANSTIIGRNISQTYKITGRDSGTVGSGDDVDIAFTAVGNLTGGSRDDYFLIKPDGSVSGNLEGGGDSDHLFVSSKPSAVVFDLERHKVSYVDGTFTGFETIAGNGASSTIVGSNAGQLFTIMGADAGTTGGVNFIAIGNLVGGTGNDTFVGLEGSKLSGTIVDLGGPVTLSGALTSEMPQSYHGAATLASDTDLNARTVFLSGVSGNGCDLTINGNAELHAADVTGVKDFHVTGTTTANVANVSSSGTQLFDQKVTLGQDARLSGSAVTVNAVDGGSHDLTIASNGAGGITLKDVVITSGDVTLEAAAGPITETGSGRISAASLTTASAGGQSLGGANSVQSFSAANSGNGSIEFNNSSETLTVAGIDNGGDIAVTNNGKISLTGVVNTPGNVSLTAVGGTIAESGAGAVTNAAQLTTTSTGGQTLGGANSVRSFSATNTGGDVIFKNGAPTLTLAGISQSAGGKIEVTNTGKITVDGPVTSHDDISLTAAPASDPSSSIDLRGRVETTGDVHLVAGGAITEGDGAVIKAATLTTKSSGGQTLLATNTVNSFTAENAGGGAIAFKNDSGSLLNLGQVVQTGGGDIRITNTGDIKIAGLAGTSDSDTLALTSQYGRITDGNGSLQAGALEFTAATIGAGNSDPIRIEARSVTTNTTGEVAGISGDFVGSAREFTVNDAAPSVVLLNGVVVGGKLGSRFQEAVQLGGSNAAMAVNAQEMNKMLMLANFQEFFTQAPNSYFVDADDPAFAPVQEIIPGFLSDGRPCQLIDSKIK